MMQVTTKDMEEDGHIPRPAWLGAAVHVFNFVIACGDFLLAHPRSFSKRAEQLSLGITAMYVSWILVCSYFNQSFPYPFLNKLPWPQVTLSFLVHPPPFFKPSPPPLVDSFPRLPILFQTTDVQLCTMWGRTTGLFVSSPQINGWAVQWLYRHCTMVVQTFLVGPIQAYPGAIRCHA
jgi:hypothetical protein